MVLCIYLQVHFFSHLDKHDGAFFFTFSSLVEHKKVGTRFLLVSGTAHFELLSTEADILKKKTCSIHKICWIFFSGAFFIFHTVLLPKMICCEFYTFVCIVSVVCGFSFFK